MLLQLDVAIQNSINDLIASLLTNILLIDSKITLLINQNLVNPIFDLILPFTHNLPYLIFAISVTYFFFRKEKKLTMLLVIGLIVSVLTVTMFKFAVGRERPFEVYDNVRVLVPSETSSSFPSNHVQTSFLLGTIVARFHPYIGVFIYLFSLVIAFGRIYLGVHYLTDVIAGTLFGILIGWIILRLPRDVTIVKDFIQRSLKKYKKPKRRRH